MEKGRFLKKNRTGVHNGEAALWKFLFALMVLFHHIYVRRFVFEDPKYFAFAFGHIAVEFFFIVSGYYMAKKALNEQGYHVVRNTFSFLYKKVKKLFPIVFCVYLLSITLYILQNGFSLEAFFGSLPSLFLINMSGISFVNIPGMSPLWYISAMLIVMAIMFPLISKYRRKFIYFVLPLLIVGIYWYLIAKYGNLGHIYDYDFGIIRTGLLRAFGGIGLGSIIYALMPVTNVERRNLITVYTVTAMEYICLTIPFICVFILKRNLDIYLLPLIAIGAAMIFSEKSGLYKFMQNKFIFFLEKMSLFIYLLHDIVLCWVNYLLNGVVGFYYRMIIIVFVVFLLSFLAVFIGERIKYRRNKFAR